MSATRTSLLQKGNSKLGPDIFTFSIPAVQTCRLGMTKACFSACYARQRYFAMPSVVTSHARNFKLTRRKDFAKRMIAAIGRRKPRVVRIHAAGDFYSAHYAKKWLEVMRACPGTVFLFYTRTWRNPAVRAVLADMATLPNIRAWFSCDRETGRPPRMGRVRRAYMATRDDDVPPYRVHLVFRVRPRTPRKYSGGALICPVEQHVARRVAITCTSCKLCYRDRLAIPRQKAATAATT